MSDSEVLIEERRILSRPEGHGVYCRQPIGKMLKEVVPDIGRQLTTCVFQNQLRNECHNLDQDPLPSFHCISLLTLGFLLPL